MEAEGLLGDGDLQNVGANDPPNIAIELDSLCRIQVEHDDSDDNCGREKQRKFRAAANDSAENIHN